MRVGWGTVRVVLGRSRVVGKQPTWLNTAATALFRLGATTLTLVFTVATEPNTSCAKAATGNSVLL